MQPPAASSPSPNEGLRPEMKADSVLVHQDSVLQGDGGNASGEIRRGVSITYCQPWLRQFENMMLSLPPEHACRYSEEDQRRPGL